MSGFLFGLYYSFPSPYLPKQYMYVCILSCRLQKDFHLYCLIQSDQQTPKLGVFNLPDGIMETIVLIQDETARRSYSQDALYLPRTPQLLACLSSLSLECLFAFSTYPLSSSHFQEEPRPSNHPCFMDSRATQFYHQEHWVILVCFLLHKRIALRCIFKLWIMDLSRLGKWGGWV